MKRPQVGKVMTWFNGGDKEADPEENWSGGQSAVGSGKPRLATGLITTY